MTVSNHAITAANLSLVFQKWWIVPIAFLSHFILDLLPHYGQILDKRSKLFITIQIIDAITLLLVFVLIFNTNSINLAITISAVIVACMPDMIWVIRFIREQIGAVDIPKSYISKIHSFLNMHEYKNGWVFDIAWFAAMLIVFINIKT